MISLVGQSANLWNIRLKITVCFVEYIGLGARFLVLLLKYFFFETANFRGLKVIIRKIHTLLLLNTEREPNDLNFDREN